MHFNSLFEIRSNYIRFELILNAPFPIISPPITFTKHRPEDTPISYRLSSQTIKQGSDQDFSVQMNGIVPMYPRLPAATLSYLTVDMAINSDDAEDFSRIFGVDYWHTSHLYWQDRIFNEINDVIDLARAGASPQFVIRNVSPFDLRSARIVAIENGDKSTLTNYLLPQIAGNINLPREAVGRLSIPFYFINFMDARRHCAECRYREMQVAACNAIEAGSWHLWELAQGIFSLPPESQRSWRARYGAVAKTIYEECGERIHQPKEQLELVWKHRQMAMHGQDVRMDYREAHEIITALSNWMDYVEQVSAMIRKHGDGQKHQKPL